MCSMLRRWDAGQRRERGGIITRSPPPLPLATPLSRSPQRPRAMWMPGHVPPHSVVRGGGGLRRRRNMNMWQWQIVLLACSGKKRRGRRGFSFCTFISLLPIFGNRPLLQEWSRTLNFRSSTFLKESHFGPILYRFSISYLW